MKKRHQSQGNKHRDTPTRGAPSHDEIARRAFELFTKRGQMPGDELADWFEAEKELRDNAPQPSKAGKIDLGPVP